MNKSAMEATRTEYLDNFAAIKGKGYAVFISEAASILTGVSVVLSGSRPEAEKVIGLVVSRIAAIATWGLATKAGIQESEVTAALDDCRTMIDAVERAANHPESVH